MTTGSIIRRHVLSIAHILSVANVFVVAIAVWCVFRGEGPKRP